MKRVYFAILVVIFMLGSVSLLADEGKTLTPYGFVKLDGTYETGSSYPGNYAFWAQNPGESDGLFHLTANQTRLGINIKGIGFGNFKVTGKVEIDFYGGGAENKAYNFMRKAYLQVSTGTLTILAGQTSDIISPLVPSTLNYTVLWGSGNIGYRRPQIRVSNSFNMGNNKLIFEAGVVRTINEGLNGGIALGVPTFAGRCAGLFSFGKANLQVGISAHYGESKAGAEQSFSSYSFNVDLSFNFGDKIKILSEYFTGRNLGKYLGGVLQSVSKDGLEIDASGFWFNVIFKPLNMMQVSAGFGMDNPDDTHLVMGERTKNSSLFGNVVFILSKSLKVGLEISHWKTSYLDSANQKTLRIQNSWILAL